MNPIIIYTSKTGFTEKYATWIAKELKCPALPLRQADLQKLSSHAPIIYGGPLMAGKIMGLDKIKARLKNREKLIVFATGATPQDSRTVIEKVKNDNLSPEEQTDIPFFYLEGGINFERMGFFGKMILKTMQKSIAKKENRTPEEEEMLRTFVPHDSSDRSYILPLVEAVRNS